MRAHTRTLIGFLAAVMLAVACNIPQSAATPIVPIPSPSTQPGPAAAQAASQPVDVEALLRHAPVAWFAPLAPMPMSAGRNYIGSEDFMELFEPDAPWQSAAGRIQVFKLYGEWVAYHATDAQLRQAVQDIQRRGMALAVEAGPLDAPGDCGQGVESFAGRAEGLRIARRIRDAGGTLNLIALDEPYFFAHVYDGPNACHWPVDKVAVEVDKYIKSMQQEIPGVIIGDTEPLTGAADAAAYKGWLDTFRKINGYNFAFLHMDVDWARPQWPQEVKSLIEYEQQSSVPVGMIYIGNNFDASDEQYFTVTGQRVKKLELQAGAVPAHVVFQSWVDKPDHALPETQPNTWTSFINQYFTDKTALGQKREGAGANLALEKPALVSRELGQDVGSLAVDGDVGTLWNSGDAPTQWIEIDLGAEYSIRAIRMVPSQYPAGRTVHRVTVRGADGSARELYVFDGATEDGQVLEHVLASPEVGVRYVRVETVSSPSWVAWREIEVIAAD
ncbi:MAG TPA: discoidin domain-containing protein [Anaerolineales bacterium]|nr:discoidin domain-containing protein [Anaerolineales bacterium]